MEFSFLRDACQQSRLKDTVHKQHSVPTDLTTTTFLKMLASVNLRSINEAAGEHAASRQFAKGTTEQQTRAKDQTHLTASSHGAKRRRASLGHFEASVSDASLSEGELRLNRLQRILRTDCRRASVDAVSVGV